MTLMFEEGERIARRWELAIAEPFEELAASLASASGAAATEVDPTQPPAPAGEAPAAPVFIDGEKAMTLRGENIAEEFTAIVDRYVARTYQRKIASPS